MTRKTPPKNNNKKSVRPSDQINPSYNLYGVVHAVPINLFFLPLLFANMSLLQSQLKTNIAFLAMLFQKHGCDRVKV